MANADIEKFRARIRKHITDNEKGEIAFYILVNAITEDCERWRASKVYKDDRDEKFLGKDV